MEKKSRTGDLEKYLENMLPLLEPIMHGAHCEHETVGYVGAATVLALFVNEVLIPMEVGEYDPQKVTEKNAPKPNVKAEGLKQPPIDMIKKKVEEYQRLVPAAQKIKEAVERFDCTKEERDKALAQDKTVEKMREANPSHVYNRFLLQNRQQYRPQELSRSQGEAFDEFDKVLNQAEAMKKFLDGNTKIEGIDQLSHHENNKETRDSTYGHSEQVLLVSELWNSVVNQLIDNLVQQAIGLWTKKLHLRITYANVILT